MKDSAKDTTKSALPSAASHRGKKRSFARLSTVQQDLATDIFVEALAGYLGHAADSNQKLNRAHLLSEVAESFEKRTKIRVNFDKRSFDVFMRAAYQCDCIKLVARTNSASEQKIRKEFRIHDTTVVSGNSSDRFASVAALRLVEELDRIRQIKKPGTVLSVGIVSGSTTRRVIDRVCELDWQRSFGIEPASLGKMNIFALNVSFADPEYLGGNATILAYKLAEKIKAGGGAPRAFGLSAPLVVEKDQIKEVDQRSQVKQVLQHTQPFRVDGNSDPAATELDLILTGAGERRSPGQSEGTSIFHRLARDYDLNIEQVEMQNNMIGDIAYIPISLNGEAKLHNTQGKEFEFYSAVRLPVIEGMARDPSKTVMLVAQSTVEKYKIPVIYAALGGGAEMPQKLYVSHLVVDESTAHGLITF